MTSRGTLENRPDVLRRMADGLWSDLEQGRSLTHGQWEAAVEASFRIGVHPATDPATALRMLTRAHRADGTNPKHPYHVGLLYLRHGQPDAAVRWFTAAADLSPANHRIWAHLSLAYRGLDDQRKGADDGHHARAEAIAATIREGRHDFVWEGSQEGAEATPPPALPLLRPGECRWTGIHDMTADVRLRGNTTAQTRDVLAAELETIAERARRRRGGTASFTVLAVQWMVYGYPTATVRRLAKLLPPDDGPAAHLLYLVCDLLETDPAELPDRLAACLADRSLPDVLIALIHRRSLFRRPLRFPDLGAHAAAREFTEGDHTRHEKALRLVAEQLALTSAGPLADVPRQAGTAEPEALDPDGRLAAFEKTAADLTRLARDVQAHIKALAGTPVTDPAGYALAAGDRDVLTDLVKRLEAVRQSRLEELQQFQAAEPSGLVMPFEEFQRRVGECQSSLQEPLGSLRAVLNRRVNKQLDAKKADFGTAVPAPSDRAMALVDRLATLEGPPGGFPSPDGELALLEEAADRLTDVTDDALDHAKALVKAAVDQEPDYARALGDHQALADLVVRLEAVRMDRLEALQRLKAPEVSASGLVLPFAEFQRRLEECESSLQEGPGKVRGILTKKVGKRLAPQQAVFPATAPAPSPAALALAERLSGLDPDPDPATPVAADAAPRRPSPPPPPEQAGPRERVQHALAVAEHALHANFAEAWQTLDAYPAELRHREAVVLLRTYLGGHQAEADQRLGRSAAARRRWNTMLADDPLHPAVLRNLAVAHTVAGDLGQAAQAWSRDLEAQYLRAVLDGDIRGGAAERAALHRALAASFGTAPLCPPLTADQETDENQGQVVRLLAGAGKVTTAVAHLRLEELNHALSHRSSTLVLGVGRSVKDTELAAARDRRKAAVEEAVGLLPPKVRAAFRKLCDEMIDAAHRDASRTRGRTRRADSEAEETAHQEWARGRLLWKVKLAGAVQGQDSAWPMAEHSGDVIANLGRIDSLPLDPADEGLLRGAQQLGARGDATEVIEQLNHLRQTACEFAVKWIYRAAQDAASGPATRHFSDRFRRMALSWGRNSDAVPEAYAGHLDDPYQIYSPSAESAFDLLKRLRETGLPADEEQRKILTAAATALERWRDRLPGATGPARNLAVLLTALDRFDEARAVLSRARREAFGELGRRQVAIAFARLDISGERFAEAVELVRELLDEDPDDQRLRALLAEAYNDWINSGKDVPTASSVAEDFARWTDDATVRNRRVLVVNAALAADRSHLDPVATARALSEDLRNLCEQDPENAAGQEQLVVALYQEALAVRTEIRSTTGTLRRTLSDELKAVRTKCAERATELLESPLLADGERREQIQQILRAVRPEEQRPPGT
ncbi:tetratricopeptide repeat protein [Streptomyces sp. NPDC088719]|uniref:tetratricopeptide repeat protein n=1 Tax=Streptomyces sp. NPDC088719 TaxID=3365872 RepID=UPI003803D153